MKRSWAFEATTSGRRIRSRSLLSANNEKQVPTYPIVDWIPTHPVADLIKYPKAGDPNPAVRLGAPRLSQLFDLTFDLSAFDLFAAWQSGACVCCPEAGQLLRPAEFVRESGLTVWFSVPSDRDVPGAPTAVSSPACSLRCD